MAYCLLILSILVLEIEYITLIFINVLARKTIHFFILQITRKVMGKLRTQKSCWQKNVDDKGDIAKRICSQMAKSGFTNRGVKTRTDLYFLNHTKAPAILIEVCFVDDKDDYMLYTSDRNAVVGEIVKAVVKHNKLYWNYFVL